MPAPAHMRATFSGVFGSTTQPTEIWAFNINFRTPAAATVPGLTTIANEFLGAYVTHLKPIYDTDLTLTKVRCAVVGANGLVERGAGGEYVQADAIGAVAGANGATAANRKPLQTALVVSLMTARPGASGKGRFFLPYPQAQSLDGDYRVSAAQAQANADRMKLFINELRTDAGTACVVASGGSATTGLAPTLSDVTGVRVGRVPDTMRSRRSALLEGYAIATL